MSNTICGNNTICSDALLVGNTPSQVSVDVASLTGWESLSSGAHNITIVAKAAGYKDSKPSAAVSVEKEPQGYTITINNIGDYGSYQIIRGSEYVNYDVGKNKGIRTYNNVTAIGIQPYSSCTISNGTGNFVNGEIYGLLEFTEDSTATLTWVD